MPARVTKVKGGYRVTNGGKVTARKTSHRKALAQVQLLHAVEHGFTPSRRRRRGKKGRR